MSQDPPQAQPPEFQRSDTARVEAFSDAVMAIAITILALALRSPQHAPGQLLTALLHQWPIYLGYVTSFAFIGVIWLNHHQAFTRIRTVDRGLHAANLALLCTTAALVFPTDVIAAALQEDLANTDARTAVGLYALVATLMCASWLAIYIHLDRHPRLLPARIEPCCPCWGPTGIRQKRAMSAASAADRVRGAARDGRGVRARREDFASNAKRPQCHRRLRPVSGAFRSHPRWQDCELHALDLPQRPCRWPFRSAACIRLKERERQSHPPWFGSHINPYGRFRLDMDTRLELPTSTRR